MFVQDLNKEGIAVGKIHGPWTIQEALAKLGFTPLALGLGGSSTWINLGDFPDNCVSRLAKCLYGISVSFKASVSGSGTGYLLSSAGVNVYYANDTMHFILQDKEKVWEVKHSYIKNTWQTFALSWSRANGLTTVIVGYTASVLRDPNGRTVTPTAVTHTSVTIGKPNSENAKYAEAAIRDVAFWDEEITEERMTKLHVCDGEFKMFVGFRLQMTNISLLIHWFCSVS